MVELLSPIALPDALAEASLGFRGCWYYGSRGLIVPIDWGQSIYHASGGVFHGRAIVPNSSIRRAGGGVFRFSRLLVLRVTRAYSSDRLGTIDLRVDQTGRVAHRVNLPRYPGKRKELHFGVGFSKRNFSGF